MHLMTSKACVAVRKSENELCPAKLRYTCQPTRRGVQGFFLCFELLFNSRTVPPLLSLEKRGLFSALHECGLAELISIHTFTQAQVVADKRKTGRIRPTGFYIYIFFWDCCELYIANDITMYRATRPMTVMLCRVQKSNPPVPNTMRSIIPITILRKSLACSSLMTEMQLD